MESVPKTITKTRFKAQTLEYCREVERGGHELVITDHGRPVLRILPYRTQDPEEQLRYFRGTVLHFEEPTEPVATDDWEALR